MIRFTSLVWIVLVFCLVGTNLQPTPAQSLRGSIEQDGQFGRRIIRPGGVIQRIPRPTRDQAEPAYTGHLVPEEGSVDPQTTYRLQADEISLRIQGLRPGFPPQPSFDYSSAALRSDSSFSGRPVGLRSERRFQLSSGTEAPATELDQFFAPEVPAGAQSQMTPSAGAKLHQIELQYQAGVARAKTRSGAVVPAWVPVEADTCYCNSCIPSPECINERNSAIYGPRYSSLPLLGH